MQRMLVPIIACLIVLLNLVVAGAAQAQSLLQVTPTIVAAIEQPEVLQQIEAELMQLEGLLTPEQREQFEAAIADGKSFRKAFKTVTLTPTQKGQLASLFKTFPQKDAFAALTPDQKKEFFLKKKEMFMPTPEEIGERINAGMKKKEMFMPTSDEIKGKIDAGMKNKENYMPNIEAITEKITQKMSAIKEGIKDAAE